MTEIDLKQFEPKAHPAKAVLQKHNIPMAVVANYLGINYPYACNLLRGTIRMPQHHQEKLDALVKQLQVQSAQTDRTDLEEGRA